LSIIEITLKSSTFNALKKNKKMKRKGLALHWRIIIGLVLGIVWAVVASYTGLSVFTLRWINPFGVIFINLLKLIAVPLVLFSIISGISSMGDASTLGKIGIKNSPGIYHDVLAVSIGLLVVNTMAGKTVNQEPFGQPKKYELWAQQIIDYQRSRCIAFARKQRRTEKIAK